MASKFYVLIICALLMAATGCQQNVSLTEAAPNAEIAASAETANAVPDSGADICGLLKASEIESVQGEKIIESKPSSQNSDTFLVSHCYYVASENAKSVVVSIYRPDPGNPAGKHPKEFWKDRFADVGKERTKESKSGGKSKEEEFEPPKPIRELGDQAYWLDNKLGGALYVLRGDEFFRVSVGGTANAELRINKAKSIAQAALKSL